MVISRETDYAVRVLRSLSDGELHSIGSVCDKERIPLQMGHKIISRLQDASVITCTRGRNGGCSLCVDLHGITLFDVMHAVGNECCINLCLAPGHVCPWKKAHADTSHIHTTLAELQEEMDKKLRGMDMHKVIFG